VLAKGTSVRIPRMATLASRPAQRGFQPRVVVSDVAGERIDENQSASPGQRSLAAPAVRDVHALSCSVAIPEAQQCLKVWDMKRVVLKFQKESSADEFT
jgi:hypothetical protein